MITDRSEEPFGLKTDFDKDMMPLDTQHKINDLNYIVFSPKDTTNPLLFKTQEGTNNLQDLDIFPPTLDRKIISSSTNDCMHE